MRQLTAKGNVVMGYIAVKTLDRLSLDRIDFLLGTLDPRVAACHLVGIRAPPVVGKYSTTVDPVVQVRSG